tara:strand:+ start:5422 stop:6408 length:987 start_codon:yes stop_codon:yes gene_type:complete
MTPVEKRTVFYHHPCLDGTTAAWAAYQKLGDTASYIGLDHSDYETITETILNNVTPETIAVFLDFAPRREVLENIIDHVKGIEIFDHHISAQKSLAAFSDHSKCHIVFDMDRSGAGMAYDIFSDGSPRPLFINLVEKLDLYQPQKFDTPDQFYDVSAHLSSIDVDRPLAQMLPVIDELIQQSDVQWFEQAGHPKRMAYREKIEEVLDGMEMINLALLDHADGCYQVPSVNARIDDLGHEFSPMLLSACPHEKKMGLIWHRHSDEVVKVSLRSDQKIDVSMVAEEMAEKYGENGGGHKGAAAARFTTDQFNDFAEEVGLTFNVLKAASD